MVFLHFLIYFFLLFLGDFIFGWFDTLDKLFFIIFFRGEVLFSIFVVILIKFQFFLNLWFYEKKKNERLKKAFLSWYHYFFNKFFILILYYLI